MPSPIFWCGLQGCHNPLLAEPKGQFMDLACPHHGVRTVMPLQAYHYLKAGVQAGRLLLTDGLRVVAATGVLGNSDEWPAHLALLKDEVDVGLHASPVGRWWVVKTAGPKGMLRFVKPGLPGVRPLGTMVVQ